jgi:hypothetical protein
VQEEPNKNYFSLSAILPMTLNAFCELIRSFTMVSKFGSQYQEGWVLRFFRLVGLVFPGAVEHLITYPKIMLMPHDWDQFSPRWIDDVMQSWLTWIDDYDIKCITMQLLFFQYLTWISVST